MFEGQVVIMQKADFEVLQSKLENIERLLTMSSNVHQPEPDGLLYPKEAWEYLKIGRTKFYELVSEGKIAFEMVGNIKRFRKSTLLRVDSNLLSPKPKTKTLQK